ncbi:MAG: DUF4293 domain-containing protein [Flavobacteriales bacterium CG_4_9_14_3_um_filter_40_17]|nr:MAG: DUF4293 domain-containing protein [Flavobacteriales bacterium CG_4_9_14_3_um_filter_40_17]
MVQRIQTVYLLLVVIFSLLAIFSFPVWTDATKTAILARSIPVLWVCFSAVAVLAFYSILKFNKRQFQFVINRINILINLFLLGFFAYQSLNLSGEAQVSEKGIGMLIPIFSIVLLVFANKAIKRDEALVKSADRLR